MNLYESNFNPNEIKCSLCYLFCRKIIQFTIKTPGYKQYKLSVVWPFLSTTVDVSKVFLFSHFIQARRDRYMHTLKSKHTNVNIIFFIVLFSNGVGVSIVCMVNRLWSGWSGICIQSGARNLSVFWNVQTGFGTYPASCSVGTGALSLDQGSFLRLGLFPQRWSSWGVRLTTQLLLMLGVRLSGAILHSTYLWFLPYVGTTVTFYCFQISDSLQECNVNKI